MALSSKQLVPLFSALAMILVVTALWWLRPKDSIETDPRQRAIAPALHPSTIDPALADVTGPVPDPDPPPDSENLPAAMFSVLAEQPEWRALEAYHETITRSDFERLLSEVFTTSDAWRNYITLSDTEATIYTGRPEPEDFFILRFATGHPTPLPRSWQATVELPPAPADRPLQGLHIAIDAGHIGGEWAKMEERWFVVGDGKPVLEGDMTLEVAFLLRPQLEKLGATVSLVRESSEPVTSLRPESLSSIAQDAHAPQDSPLAMRRFAEQLFYRTAEIRARAALVNQTLMPDLVICLHFNAEAWGDPTNPTLVSDHHFHLLLNGAYNDEEIALEDQRFAMLAKLLQRTHEEEALVGANLAEVFAEMTGLPPYTYSSGNSNVRQVGNQPYVWARNLLANRLYNCPVIFMEPYVMNSEPDYARIQEGDYEGLRKIGNKMRPSILREYATGVAAGLARHYSQNRPIID
jgi:N-acetylmuramoyl-L-alanine amidase